MGNNAQSNVINIKKAKNTNIYQQNVSMSNGKYDFQEYFSNLLQERPKNQSEHSIYIYDTCPIELIGRKKELELLENFVDDDRRISWWAITGLPGSGKTRLAYEFVHYLNENKDWIARFIPWTIFIKEFEKYDFDTQNIDKNFFFVIDYMYAYEEQIALWLEWLVNKFPINCKLRVLIIEREYAQRLACDPWEQFFMNGFMAPNNFYALKYKEVNLNLNSYLLGEEESKRIIKNYCQAKGQVLTDAETEYVFTLSIKANNNKSSPLLLMIFAEYFLSEKQVGLNIGLYETALSRIVNREKDVTYKTVGAKSTLDKLIVEELIVVSTVLGEIDIENDFEFLLNLVRVPKNKLVDWFERFSQTPLLFVGYDNKCILKGIQPDLIGEYLVYEYFKNISFDKAKKILDSINEHNPKKFLSFLSRFIADHRERLQDSRKLDLFSAYIPEDRSMMFKVINEQGYEVECEVLFTFESDETNKNYIVYTDNTFDDEGNTKVYASIYDPDCDETKLLPIETEKEWQTIEILLSEIQEDVENSDFDVDTAELSSNIEKKFKSI